MEIIDPGHKYMLHCLDAKANEEKEIPLQFVKRIGEHYPGNTGESYSGPIVQEVLLVLIDRIKYVNNQIMAEENESVLNSLRLAIFFLETRAKRVRGEILSFDIYDIDKIEYMKYCKQCGHIECTKHNS